MAGKRGGGGGTVAKLRDRLVTNPAARAKFLSGYLDLLEAHGVNVNDPQVLQELGLNLDLSDGPAFVKGLGDAGAQIITISVVE